MFCNCTPGAHVPGCPLGGTAGGTITVPPTPNLPLLPARAGWICPRCSSGVSPDRDTCPCGENRDLSPASPTWVAS